MSAAEPTSNPALRPIGLVKASRPEKPSAPLPAQPQPIAPKPTRRLDKQEAMFRVVIVIVILASLALAWWSLTKVLVPVQKQARELTSTGARLSAEVDQLERKWTKLEAEEIRTKYSEIHSQLFADEAALGAWLAHLQERALPLALDARVDFGKSTPHASTNEKLAVVPTTVSLDAGPVAGTTESPYQRLLRLGQQLAAEGRRADLAELTVAGGPNSITHSTLVFNLWAGEEGRP